jgi:hypothetical protein
MGAFGPRHCNGGVMRGYVYVLTNEAFPDLVKVGFSTKDPSLRVSELSNTSVPTPFKIFYEVLVDDPYELEQKVHARLRDNGEHAGKEFFRVAPKQALSILRKVMEETGRIALFEQEPAYRCQKCGNWTIGACSCNQSSGVYAKPMQANEFPIEVYPGLFTREDFKPLLSEFLPESNKFQPHIFDSYDFELFDRARSGDLFAMFASAYRLLACVDIFCEIPQILMADSKVKCNTLGFNE